MTRVTGPPRESLAAGGRCQAAGGAGCPPGRPQGAAGARAQGLVTLLPVSAGSSSRVCVRPWPVAQRQGTPLAVNPHISALRAPRSEAPQCRCMRGRLADRQADWSQGIWKWGSGAVNRPRRPQRPARACATACAARSPTCRRRARSGNARCPVASAGEEATGRHRRARSWRWLGCEPQHMARYDPEENGSDAQRVISASVGAGSSLRPIMRRSAPMALSMARSLQSSMRQPISAALKPIFTGWPWSRAKLTLGPFAFVAGGGR